MTNTTQPYKFFEEGDVKWTQQEILLVNKALLETILENRALKREIEKLKMKQAKS